MRNWIMRWIASALALFVITQLHIGITVKDLPTLIITVVVLGFVNSCIRPLIMLFVWPINCLTFGLLGFVINVALFFGVGKLGFGFDVATPMAALIGSVAMGLISGVLNFLFKDRNDRDA